MNLLQDFLLFPLDLTAWYRPRLFRSSAFWWYELSSAARPGLAWIKNQNSAYGFCAAYGFYAAYGFNIYHTFQCCCPLISTEAKLREYPVYFPQISFKSVVGTVPLFLWKLIDSNFQTLLLLYIILYIFIYICYILHWKLKQFSFKSQITCKILMINLESIDWFWYVIFIFI